MLEWVVRSGEDFLAASLDGEGTVVIVELLSAQ